MKLKTLVTKYTDTLTFKFILSGASRYFKDRFKSVDKYKTCASKSIKMYY